MSKGKRKEKTVFSSIITDFDSETGELKRSVSESTVIKTREPPFVKMYIEDIGLLLGLSPGRRTILHELVMYINYEGTLVTNKHIREKIAEKIGSTDGSIRNAVSAYAKMGVFTKIHSNYYEVNPFLFAKGEWKDIEKRRIEFELKIRYSPDGKRKISTKTKKVKTDLELVG